MMELCARYRRDDMSTIGDLLVSCLRRTKVQGLDEDHIATLLRTSSDARRMVLEDLCDSTDPIDKKLYSAVLELSKSEGEVESLTYAIRVEPDDLRSKIVHQGEEEPRIGDLIVSMYGSG